MAKHSQYNEIKLYIRCYKVHIVAVYSYTQSRRQRRTQFLYPSEKADNKLTNP